MNDENCLQCGMRIKDADHPEKFCSESCKEVHDAIKAMEHGRAA